ncbi:hypothetical protein LMG31506_00253 [Cupriavidus yeoncheonensis]|uniref:Uncharacterized protein n=1 Tax=Cupriavidus yeoncheonensis TaxID=1462994 RepID=A0A916MVT8_9BURK|nr:hypothetical protein [Cupriavidus yeoncheonensis]CAG2126949.1 hypothetical protein LMG31506_00253 [Cupriavidus yeoncheonensis]
MKKNPFEGRYKEPLTDEQLREMWHRNRSPEVRALLWEIARLQSIVRRAWQFQSCFPKAEYHTANAQSMILWHLRNEMSIEPYLHGEVKVDTPSVPLDDHEVVANFWSAGRAARRRRNG